MLERNNMWIDNMQQVKLSKGVGSLKRFLIYIYIYQKIGLKAFVHT